MRWLVRILMTFVFAASLGCAERAGPESSSRGRLDSLPQMISELGGLGVFINHEGFEFEVASGEMVKAMGMRAPFKVARRSLFDGLHVGDQIDFRFRPLRGSELFPFEVTSVSRVVERNGR